MLLPWAQQASSMLALAIVWTSLSSSAKAALVLVAIAVAIAVVRAKEACKRAAGTLATVKHHSLLDVLQGAVISQHVPEILALTLLSLSGDEQKMVIKRLPTSLQDIMMTKVVYLLPKRVQSILGAPDKDELKEDISPVDAPYLPDMTVQDIPSVLTVTKNPIRRKRYEDIPELRENLFVKIFAYRLAESWKSSKKILLNSAWVISSVLFVISVIRYMRSIPSRILGIRKAFLMWVVLTALKWQSRWIKPSSDES
jgi:hypothetical protein